MNAKEFSENYPSYIETIKKVTKNEYLPLLEEMLKWDPNELKTSKTWFPTENEALGFTYRIFLNEVIRKEKETLKELEVIINKYEKIKNLNQGIDFYLINGIIQPVSITFQNGNEKSGWIFLETWKKKTLFCEGTFYTEPFENINIVRHMRSDYYYYNKEG
ncbi:MAG: hypothetical protein Q8867_08940 [Bacteroidota bacterium]|nr:hypothetical protein [Bacteroidota bacterium]